MSRIPQGVVQIASQPAKPRPMVHGTGAGTQRAKSYGSTQGMKPKDFATFKGIANQKVKRNAAGLVKHEWMLEEQPKPERTPKEKENAEEKLIAKAKKRFLLAQESEATVRKHSLADLKFLAGEQWDDGIKRQRQMDGRPCLTINRLPQFVRQVTNEQRQNRPGIQVNPVDDEADVDTAEILQGIMRHIEYDSAADAAYDTAFFHAASCGFGYWRVTTEYSGPMSFEQDIKIKRIRNPFTVYLDPNAKEPDFSDAEWGFLIETMSRDAYKAAYPNTELDKMADWQSIGDTAGWVGDDTCRVAEYFWRETKKQKIAQLNDGSTVLKSLLPEQLPEGLSIVQERDTEVTTVQWAKVNGIEVLEETDWAGRWIPIVKVVGDEFDIDGEIVLKGIVRDAKEPQMQYNFMKSASVEAIALAPKAPYIGAIGQFEGREQQWQEANIKSYAYLEYNAVDVQGRPMAAPQRQTVEPAIQAIAMAMGQAQDDMKAVTGIYDQSLGAGTNDVSGKAILARQQQSQSGNFHYIDNLTRAIRHSARIIEDLIPKIYDTPRVLRIIGEDGSQSTVPINQHLQPGAQPQEDNTLLTEEGKVEKIYDLGVGKYDVTISTGPSYQTKRQEAVTSILDLVKNYPTLMGVAGDILVKNMDWPGAQEIAKRLAKSMPPQFQDDDDNQSELPPQVQQQLQQLVQQNQQLQQALAHAENDVKQSVSLKQLETSSKERIAAGQIRVEEAKLEIARLQVQASILIAQSKVDAAATDKNAQREYDFISQRLDQVHEAALSQMDHENGLEAMGAKQASQTQPMNEDDAAAGQEQLAPQQQFAPQQQAGQ